jgi:hypothetical protein
MTSLPRQRRPLPFARFVLLGLLVSVVVACSSAAGSSSAPPAASSPSPSLIAGTDPNEPVGTDLPPGGSNPGLPDPAAGRIVVPKPGQLDVHPLPAESFSAAVEGRHVVVTIAFTSGVEPCSILDSIVVARAAGSFTMTLREGRGPGDVVCIEIAEMKRALVDLGDLAPGTYDIRDGAGGAPPITVTIV